MRIPRSAIVMGLVTAVPFGLGVREVLTSKPSASHADPSDLGSFGEAQSRADRERQLAEYEEQMRQEQAEREERSKARIAKLDQLFGSQPAAMGTVLDGLELGGFPYARGEIRRRIDEFNSNGIAWISLDGSSVLDAVEVAIHTDYETADACEQLDDKLVAAWGHSVNGVWLDPSTHRRATLTNDESCELRFERYIEPADFVAALPFAAIGKTIEAYAKQFGEDLRYDGGSTRQLPGVGAAKGRTRIEIFAERGRIIGFTVMSGADFDSLTAIRDGISARVKSQPTQSTDEDYPNAVVWEWKKGRTPVSLAQTGVDTFSITAGDLPWD